MTTATTEGRRLVLTVDGIDEPFYVDPIPAKRGKILTDRFIAIAVGAAQGSSEGIFIEAIGPANYSRLTGLYVDLVRLVGEDMTPEVVATFDDTGIIKGDPDAVPGLISRGAVFIAREAHDDEQEIVGVPMRQEESEALVLCAFYWQGVVGIEAVNAFIENGEGTAGSLKALRLLQMRLGLLPSTNSSREVMESVMQGAGSEGTSTTPTSSGSVRLPADHKPPRNPAKAKAKRRQ